MSVQNLYLTFLKQCAKLQLLKNHPEIIGITGSAGKSSAVLATYLVLESKFGKQVHYTKKGNSETGIPYEILDIPVENYEGARWLIPPFLALWKLLTYWPTYKYFVVEMGIDSDQSPKNMEYLLKILSPKVGAFLNVSSVHGQNFQGQDTIQAIANEKRKLLSALPQEGLAIYSADHSQITNALSALSAQQVTFSVSGEPADVVLKKYTPNLQGTQFEFQHQAKNFTLSFSKQLHTQAAFGSFATALLVGENYGISFEEGITALEKTFTIPAGRMNIFEGIHQTILIDSSYNSSPESTASALEMIETLPAKGRKVLILGDMRELGASEGEAHQQLAIQAAKVADVLVWVGPLTQKYAYDYLKKKGIKKPNHAFRNAWEAVSAVKEIIKAGDVVFLKGSQNTILLEIITETLLANPKADLDALPRRSEFWESQRQQLKKE